MSACEWGEELRHAIEQWLAAREAVYVGSREEALAAYRAADQRLLAAFVADWGSPDPSLLSRAYPDFRRALVACAGRAQGEEAWQPETFACA